MSEDAGKFEKKRSEKRRVKTMDVILVVIAVMLTAFTVSMIHIFRETGMVPDTLIACVFACLGTECGAMAWIKNTKERYQAREWELEDRAEEKAERDRLQEKGGDNAHTESYL